MRRYEDEFDVTIEHAWGMTETMSIDSVSRPKDVIKSGGEWITSIALENALMAHDAVVAAEDSDPGEDELQDHLRETLNQPDWWLPDEIRVVEQIPKTATGKFDEKGLREKLDVADDETEDQ